MGTKGHTLNAVLNLPSGANWLKADLHIHTPGSGNDFKGNGEDTTAKDIVDIAIQKGLEVIAVTDHNTVAWCDGVREAAKGTDLVVFPGAEVSTKEGHVLAIFDVDAETQELNRFLDRAEIPPDRIGHVSYSSELGIQETANVIAKFGGVAIAAHADGERGFLKSISTGLGRERAYLSKNLWAIEIVDTESREKHLSGQFFPPRRMTCLQFSDSHKLGKDMGRRSTFLKMGEKNLNGLKLALLDPDIRVAFYEDELPTPECAILGMWVTNGFLDGQKMRFNDGVNCLIGDTGSGKSLSIELIRFALDQQPEVPKIHEEIKSLLRHQLGNPGTVHVLLGRGSSKYLVERTWSDPLFAPTVQRVETNGSLTQVEASSIREFFPIKCYSQSEIIEFARDKSVRLSLTDDLIDISREVNSIRNVKGKLRQNAANIISEEDAEESIRKQIALRPTLVEQLSLVDQKLPQDRVREQENWYREQSMLDHANEEIGSLNAKIADAMSQLERLPRWGSELEELPNQDSLTRLEKAIQDWQTQVANSKLELTEKLNELVRVNSVILREWSSRFEAKEAEYRSILETLDTSGQGFPSLAEFRKKIQESIDELDERRLSLDEGVLPRIVELKKERDCLLTELQELRKSITGKRERKASELTAKLKYNVRLRVHARQDKEPFKHALTDIAVGARLREQYIDLICKSHPVPFVKKMLNNDFVYLANEYGVDASRLQTLWDVVLERKKLDELYEMQLADVDDIIEVQLEVKQGDYKNIEELSHGQKCRVVLMVALAEGDFPLLVDQPEDALHAHGIEEGIVSNLRFNRGARQCVFATRNANILVSADSDQIIALEASAESGWVESTGSLDRYDHNRLVIHHVEGGKEALRRRNSLYTLQHFVFEED